MPVEQASRRPLIAPDSLSPSPLDVREGPSLTGGEVREITARRRQVRGLLEETTFAGSLNQLADGMLSGNFFSRVVVALAAVNNQEPVEPGKLNWLLDDISGPNWVQKLAVVGFVNHQERLKDASYLPELERRFGPHGQARVKLTEDEKRDATVFLNGLDQQAVTNFVRYAVRNPPVNVYTEQLNRVLKGTLK
jgi:hypothetical protein